MSESPCDGPREIFERAGRAPTTLALDNATGAGGRPCGAVAEPGPLPRPRAHRRRASRHRDPYPGDEGGGGRSRAPRGSRGAACPSRCPGPPRPGGGGLDARLAAGCARVIASSRRRDGRPVAEAPAEDLAATPALPAEPLDAARRPSCKSDGRGHVATGEPERGGADPSAHDAHSRGAP